MAYPCDICRRATTPATANLLGGKVFRHLDCRPPRPVYAPMPTLNIQVQPPAPTYIPVPYVRPMGMRV